MKLKRISALIAAVSIAAVSLVGCGEQPVDMNALVNESLAKSGSAYTVSAVSVDNETVSLIKEAASTYDTYRSTLVDTDKYMNQLVEDAQAEAEEAAEQGDYTSYAESIFMGTDSYIIAQTYRMKKKNLQTRANFEQSVASFNDRGINKAYVITGAEVAGGPYDNQGVADYVASLLTDNAEVYISDVIEVPVLDDEYGTYTSKGSPMRYVYIKYAE